jgi:hypothetical protein
VSNCYDCTNNISKCSRCNLGYYLGGSGLNCIKCEADKYGDGIDPCRPCLSGFVGNQTSNKCESCPENCTKCLADRSTCTSCMAGFYLVNKSRCLACEEGTGSKGGAEPC